MLARILKSVDTAMLNGWHGIISFIPISILSLYIEGNPFNYLYPVQYDAVFSILHCALIVSAMGHVGMFYLYKFYPVSTVLPFYSLFPIFGIALTFVMFNEALSIYEVIGGVLVIGSAYLVHKENKKSI